MTEIRPCRPVDDASLFTLWSESLGRAWPLEAAAFAEVVQAGFVAVDAGRIVGVVALASAGSAASLQLLLVEPELRGRGIGAELHDVALEALSRRGATQLSLAGTPGKYFWPGLPAELSAARTFFETRGWEFGDTCRDLVRSLHDYETPAEVASTSAGIDCRRAGLGGRAALLEFEQLHFPHWQPYYASSAGLVSAIVAVDEQERLVGALLASDRGQPQLWHRLLGDDYGAIGAIGVADSVRGRGVGTALVAHACEQLRERGVGNCHIGWTELRSFYGLLGFLGWREYETATRKL